MTEKINIWDGNLYDGKYISGNVLHTESGAIYTVTELTEGHEYVVTLIVPSDRFKCSTFENNPVTISADGTAGIRSLYDSGSPSAGNTFTFTANLNENFLMCYVGHAYAGANNVQIGVYDMSVNDGQFTRYYYNGVLLPELPIYVSEYPYAWIRKNNTSGHYDLLLCKSKRYYNNNGIYPDDTCKWYRIDIVNSDSATEWTFYQDNKNFYGIDSARTVLWSNHDIPNGSATATDIYLYGSEPVPESGSEPDEPDEPESAKYKYLIRNQNVLYTIANGSLSTLSETELTSDIFKTHGFNELPDWSVLSELVNPEVLYWQSATEEELPSMTAIMTATPFPQTVVSPNYDMSDSTILGVECAYVTASSDVVFAISVDDGVTWYMWTGELWGTLTDTATGMTAETINAITTEQWAGLTPTGQFKVRMTLFDENSSFTSFVMDYIN